MHAFSKVSLECGLGSPVQASGPTTPWKDSQDSKKPLHTQLWFISENRVDHGQNSGKDAGVESRGDQEPARRVLSRGSCGLQAMTCDDTPAVLPAGGAHEHGGAGV